MSERLVSFPSVIQNVFVQMIISQNLELILMTFNTLDTIGGTPLVKLSKVVPENCADVYVKLEYFNPTGSKKDRMALAMIEGAESRGELKQGMKVVEFTGGSTGAGLAFACATKGYQFHAVSSDAFSKEKLDMMAAFGATVDVIESQGNGITLELVEKLRDRVNQILKTEDAYFTDQFKNQDIVKGFETLGNEVVEQLNKPIDVFCDAVGTAGSLVGVSKALKKAGQNPRVIALEPASSPVLTKGISGSHSVEGIALGFVPNLLTPDTYDEARTIEESDAREMAVRLSKEEGIFGGISGGMNVVAAIEIAKEIGPGKTVLAIICDSGLKYMSEGLYSNF